VEEENDLPTHSHTTIPIMSKTKTCVNPLFVYLCNILFSHEYLYLHPNLNTRQRYVWYQKRSSHVFIFLVLLTSLIYLNPFLIGFCIQEIYIGLVDDMTNYDLSGSIIFTYIYLFIVLFSIFPPILIVFGEDWIVALILAMFISLEYACRVWLLSSMLPWIFIILVSLHSIGFMVYGDYRTVNMGRIVFIVCHILIYISSASFEQRR